MTFRLPDLPFAKDALEPRISAETLDYHHGQHHRGYVDKLNALVAGTRFETASLEAVIREADGAVLANASQAFNHAFYWRCLRPDGGGEPHPELAVAIRESFGSVDGFRSDFDEAGIGCMGSGWVWLIADSDHALRVMTTPNAGCPVADGLHPVLTCDVWEHAYYLDHRNRRADYLEAWWSLVNWEFALDNFRDAGGVSTNQPAPVAAGGSSRIRGYR